jgi:hypothetical protein
MFHSCFTDYTTNEGRSILSGNARSSIAAVCLMPFGRIKMKLGVNFKMADW